MTAQVLDQYGGNMGLTVTWASTDATKATVNSAGLVTGAASGSCTITATYLTLSNSSSCTVQTATKLAMVTQPAGATSASAFSTQPAVRLQDAGSANVAQSGVSVTVSITSGPGSLSGTTSATTNSSGVATFTNLVITGTGAHTLAFASTGLTGVNSSSFTVAAGGGGEPTPSGNVFFDTRSGGAQDWQAATTITQMVQGYWDADYPSGTPPTDYARAVNAAGTGEVSMRVNWASSPGAEQSEQLNKYFVGSGIVSGSNTRGFGISYKRYLAPGFGYNDNGQGMKVWLALRSPDGSPDNLRIYFVENNFGYKWNIDANNYDTGTFDHPLGPSIGVVERHTHFINPAAGTIDFYRNGVLEQHISGSQNGATLGSGGIAQIQHNIAAFIQNACTQYYWDYVYWVPAP